MSNYSRGAPVSDEYRQRVRRRSGVYVSPEFNDMLSNNSPYPGSPTRRSDHSRVRRVIDENSSYVRHPQPGVNNAPYQSQQPPAPPAGLNSGRSTPTRRPIASRVQERRQIASERLGLAVGLVMVIVGVMYYVFFSTPGSVRQIHGYNKNLHSSTSNNNNNNNNNNIIETPKQLESKELQRDIASHYNARLEEKPESWFFSKSGKKIEPRNASIFSSIAFQQVCSISNNQPEPDSLIYKSLLKYGVAKDAFDCFASQKNTSDNGEQFMRHVRDVYDSTMVGNIDIVHEIDLDVDKHLVTDPRVQHALSLISQHNSLHLLDHWKELDILWNYLGTELNENIQLQAVQQQMQQSLVLLAQQLIGEKDSKEGILLKADVSLHTLDASIQGLSSSIQGKKQWEATVQTEQQDEVERQSQVKELEILVGKEKKVVMSLQEKLNERVAIVSKCEDHITDCGEDKALLLRSKVNEVEAELQNLAENQEKAVENEKQAEIVLNTAKSASIGVKREAAKLRMALRRLHGVDSVTSMGDDELYLTLNSQRDRIKYKLDHQDSNTDDHDLDMLDLADEEVEDIHCEVDDHRPECNLASKIEVLKEKKKTMLSKRFEQVDKLLRELEGESHEESMAEEVRVELGHLRSNLKEAITKWDGSRKIVEQRALEFEKAKASTQSIKQDVLKLRAGMISVLHKIAEQERESEICLLKTRRQLQEAQQAVQAVQQEFQATQELLQQHVYTMKTLQGSHQDAENEKNKKLAQFEQTINTQYGEICQATNDFLSSVATCDMERQKMLHRKKEWEALLIKVERARDKFIVSAKSVNLVKHALTKALK